MLLATDFEEIAAPRCFDRHQFQEWRAAARMARQEVTVCDDCTPEYQRQQQALDKCDHKDWRRIHFCKQGRKALDSALLRWEMREGVKNGNRQEDGASIAVQR